MANNQIATRSQRNPAKARASGEARALEIEVTSSNPVEQEKQLAAAMLRPSVRAGIMVSTWKTKQFDVGITDIVQELSAQGAKVIQGDLGRMEAMLAIQAHTLDLVFNEMGRWARLNMFENFSAAETFLRLGLKAQSQCRATIETLAAVKNPTAVAFVKQANIAHGHQQVNNGEPRPRGNQNQANELMESHERLEPRAPETAVSCDSKVATLVPIDRTENSRGKRQVKPKQPQARRKIQRDAADGQTHRQLALKR